MPTGEGHDYNRWKYDSHYDNPYYKSYDHSYPYDGYKSYEHYTPYDHYGDYGYDYGHSGGYMHADDFTAQKQEKFQGKNANA